MRVILSPAAQDDLARIYAYLAERNPDSAGRVVRAILGAANGLAQFPQIGRAGAVAGMRERVLTRYPYKIIYIVTDDVVEVARVLHSAQD